MVVGHVVLQLVNHDKCNQMPLISQTEVHQNITAINCFFPFMYHENKTMLCTKDFFKNDNGILDF